MVGFSNHTNSATTAAAPAPIASTTMHPHPFVVLLYTWLYAAFFGFVSHPQPRGALKPSWWRTTRLSDVRAARRFLSEGVLYPNFKVQRPCASLIDVREAYGTRSLIDRLESIIKLNLPLSFFVAGRAARFSSSCVGTWICPGHFAP